MNHRLRTTAPISRGSRKPAAPGQQSLVAKEESFKIPGETVWLPDRKEGERSVGEHIGLCSYEIKTSRGSFRRNRNDLV